MARIWSTGFELNWETYLGEFDNGFGGVVSVQSGTVRSGTYAGRALNSGSETRFEKRIISSDTSNVRYFQRIYVNIATLPSAITTIFDFGNGSGTRKAQIRLNTDGTLELWNESSQVGSDSSALSTETWYMIELAYEDQTGSGNSYIEGRLNGSSFASSSTSTTTGGVAFVHAGNLTNVSTIDIFFDDWGVNDETGSFENSWPDEGKIFHMRPSSGGDSSDWTNNYSYVDEITPDDATTFVSSNTTDEKSLYNLFAAPAEMDNNDVVKVVQLGVRFRGASSSSVASFRTVFLLEGESTESEGSTLTPNTTTWRTNGPNAQATYNHTLYDFPGSSTTKIRKASLADAQAGVEIVSGNTNAVNVTAIWVLVEFKELSNTNTVDYTSISGFDLLLDIYEDNSITFLVPKDSPEGANPTVIGDYASAISDAYDLLVAWTGSEPPDNDTPGTTEGFEYNNKTTFAVVPSTCGLGCGFVGSQGVEFIESHWLDETYPELNDNSRYESVPFYEMGRNFFHSSIDSKLSYVGGGTLNINNSFSRFFAFETLAHLSLDGVYNGEADSVLRSAMSDLLVSYVGDESYDWSNTLAIDTAPTNPDGLGGSDLFCAMLLYLQDNYTDQDFAENFWIEAQLRDDRSTTQDAVDNFAYAASIAANTNLINLIEDDWKFTLSDSVKAEISAAFNSKTISAKAQIGIRKTEKLVDNFNDNSLATEWSIQEDTPSEVQETNFHIEIDSDADSENRILYTKGKYDIESSYAFIAVPDLPINADEYYFEFGINDDSGSFSNIIGIEFILGENFIRGFFRDSGGSQSGSLIAWDVGTYKWLRIRESSGTLYLDYSSDSRNWSNLYSHVVGTVDINAITVFCRVVHDGGSPRTAIIDNFNVEGPTTTINAKARIVYPISRLYDNFNDNSFNSSLWSWSAPGIAEQNKQIEISGTEDNLLSNPSSGHLSLINDAIYAKIQPDAAISSYDIVFYVRDSGGNYAVFFQIDDISTLRAWRWDLSDSPFESQIASTTYNATNHKWLRIRHQGNTVYFDYSSNGRDWNNLGSFSPTTSLTNALKHARVEFYHINESGQSRTTVVDNVNVPEQAQTISAQGSIALPFSQSIQAKGSIQDSFSKTIQAKGLITSLGLQTIQALAAISIASTQTINTKGSINNSAIQTINVLGLITTLQTLSIVAKGNIKATQTDTTSSKARIGGGVFQSIEALGSIQQSSQSSISSKANIVNQFLATIIAKGNLIGQISQSINARGNISTGGPTIQAKGNIYGNSIQTITSLGRLIDAEPTTQTVTGLRAHARINPPLSFINNIEATSRYVVGRLEILWDGIDWVDETTYLLSCKANEKLSGDLGEGIASTLDVEVDNTTERFTPDNDSSPIKEYLVPRTKIRVSLTFEGYDYRMFTGYIKNIHPDDRTRICSFECFDNQVLVYNKRANGIVYEDFRTDQLMAELGELADLESDQFVLDKGDQEVNFGYFEDRNVWPIMGEIAVAERGRIFFDRYGILTFWNRSRLHNRGDSYVITRENWIKDIDYSVAEHEIKNAIIVKAAPRYSAGIKVVWSNGNAEFLNPYTDTLVYIPAKTSQNAFLDLEDPCTTFITPIQNVDYTANSEQDASGSDLTSQVEISEFINYGNAVFLSVENKANIGAYLTKFQIRGNPAQILKYIKVTAIDQPSINSYGRQELELENNFITSEEAATQIADEELERRREAINLFRIEIIGIPYLLTGDVISLEYRSGQFKDYLIQTMDWTFDEGGFQQRLTLTNPYTFPTVTTMTARAFIIQGDHVAHIQAKAEIS